MRLRCGEEGVRDVLRCDYTAVKTATHREVADLQLQILIQEEIVRF